MSTRVESLADHHALEQMVEDATSSKKGRLLGLGTSAVQAHFHMFELLTDN